MASNRKDISIIYDIEEIFNCRDNNYTVIDNLKKYFNKESTLADGEINYDINKYDESVLYELLGSMKEITESYLKGVDPNDIELMNSIRDNMNKINKNNYNDIIEGLKVLNYSNKDNFEFLANEIIVRSMNDNMASRGMESENKDNLTPSEIYMKVAIEFKKICIEIDNDKISFYRILIEQCYSYFNQYMDITKKLDSNNPQRVKNYKGFMNMIGLLYLNKMIPMKLVMNCYDTLVEIITNKKNSLEHEERDNYYVGYARMTEKILKTFETSVESEKVCEEVLEYYEYLNDKNELILSMSESSKKTENIMKRFSKSIHKNNMIRLDNLYKKYSSMTFDDKIVEE
jgi:hypothetical protein